MSDSDRAIAEQVHAVIAADAPQLTPRLWYGMPAYALDGKIVCHFQPAAKFTTRYATLGFSDRARFDSGPMWETSLAIAEPTAETEARIGELLRRALAEAPLT
ncbi:iron chaperone [Paramicrobacterium humi]|uniref:iron chaperone n=1 Tax=Paramicrobacterium humi TaxID=640635 RepID=UPI000B2839AF